MADLASRTLWANKTIPGIWQAATVSLLFKCCASWGLSPIPDVILIFFCCLFCNTCVCKCVREGRRLYMEITSLNHTFFLDTKGRAWRWLSDFSKGSEWYNISAWYQLWESFSPWPWIKRSTRLWPWQTSWGDTISTRSNGKVFCRFCLLGNIFWW